MYYPSYDEWYENHSDDIIEEYEEMEKDIEEVDWLREYEDYISGLECQAYDEWRDSKLMENVE